MNIQPLDITLISGIVKELKYSSTDIIDLRSILFTV